MHAKPRSGELKILATAAILALLAKPAWAQETMGTLKPEEFPQNKELDRAYKETIDRMPTPKSSRDPWGSVRAATPSKDGKNNPSPSSK